MLAHERLSALDATFLDLETDRTHMHVCAVLILDARPLAGPEGGVDIARVRAYVASVLHEIPRYRQKVVHVPLLGHPVWVDDARFKLSYHVRHSCLPWPGSTALLESLAGRIMSQKLDRTRPLWELWVVEGLASNRAALIAKVHHCLVDGVAGIDLLMKMARLTADATIEPCRPWIPRSSPRAARLLAGEMYCRLAAPLDLVSQLRSSLADPNGAWRSLGAGARGIAEAAQAGLQPASWTPLNVEIGPHRRFHWRRFAFAEVKTIAERLGGTVNDVVLAVVAGGLRSFLRRRGFSTRGKTIRALVPVSTRRTEERGTLGNHVATLVAPLPIHCADAVRRLAMVASSTTALKQSKQVTGIQFVEELADRLWPRFLTQVFHLAMHRSPANLVVTNVPGPPVPLYFLGARVLEIYPMVPLFERQALGIALFSYNGYLFWGFNADYDALTDLEAVGDAVAASFAELLAASDHRQRAVAANAADRGVLSLPQEGTVHLWGGVHLQPPPPAPLQ